MNAGAFLKEIKNIGIDIICGVPDSTLKELCDEVQNDNGMLFKHYVTANEGAAVGLASGVYLSTQKPACIYMQNSGIGNIINPLASIANNEVYGIPMLFVIGWRGEPGEKDEPQHKFQGKITCQLMEVMNVKYCVIDKNTTVDELKTILKEAIECFEKRLQYAIIVKKGTFEGSSKFVWDNGYELNRENALKIILQNLYKTSYLISTTGKISRELYEQSDELFGEHKRIFMTVGGMGHASMIAYGAAQTDSSKKIVCVDGDGAVMMHMGSLAFIAHQKPENYLHIVINNAAHESVGAMPTGYSGNSYVQIAKACGYENVYSAKNEYELTDILEKCRNADKLTFIEVMVSLNSRKDLGRPKETAMENCDNFIAEYKR